MNAPPPIHLLLAGSPDAPGAAGWLQRAAGEAARGAPVRVLLTGAGLAWLGPDLPRAFADVALCSRSARDRGLGLDDVPAGVRWSSLTAWLGDVGATDRVWGLFP